MLPAAVSAEPERLARFEREAKLLAQLNHPGIATLYGFDREGDTPYLVMELVEGETLAERIGRGPMPWDEARALFGQITEALEAAHESGVLHRDLKPANIMITPDGRVKILDFGLAKALQEDPVDAATSQSPTLTKGTALGAILGTPSYMSPEQTRGKVLDRRSDIWAFGCCLYEALTGKKAFDGETVSDILAAVLKNEPDWNVLAPRARAVLQRCLEKDPKRRLRDIADVWLDVEILVETRKPGVPPWTVALAAIAGGVAVWLSMRGDAAPRPVRRTAIVFPADARMVQRPGGADVFAISPKGDRIAYIGDGEDGAQPIFVRALDRLEPEPVPGTEDALALFFSPDGEELGFIVGDQLKRVRLDGSAALEICDGVSSARWAGAAWMADGTIVLSRVSRGLWRVPSTGGDPELWVAPDPEKGEKTHTRPQALPDSWVMYSVALEESDRKLIVQSLATGERRLVEGASGLALYVDSGHLIFARGESVVAAPFDLERHEITGPPFSLAPELTNWVGVRTPFEVSREGTLLYHKGTRGRELAIVARDGTLTSDVFDGGDAELTLRIAPDGDRYVVEQRSDTGSDLWIHSLRADEPAVRLTFQGRNRMPLWSPDGGSVIFIETSGVESQIVSAAADGSQLEPELLVTTERGHGLPVPSSISKDGEELLYFLAGSKGWEIWAVSLDEDLSRRKLLSSTFKEAHPRISPDSRMLAYTSNRSGRVEVWLRSYPDVDATTPVQVSTNGGTHPLWSPDGSELYYLADNSVVRLAVVPGDRPELGTATAVANVDFGAEPGWGYDVTPDGRILMIRNTADSTEQDHLIVVDGWFDELRRLESAASR